MLIGLVLQLGIHRICLVLQSGVLTFFLVQFYDLEKHTKDKMEIKKSKCEHKCLKVVEVIGFVGCGVDMEIAKYILSHTVSLEKIIINPCHPFIVSSDN